MKTAYEKFYNHGYTAGKIDKSLEELEQKWFDGNCYHTLIKINDKQAKCDHCDLIVDVKEEK